MLKRHAVFIIGMVVFGGCGKVFQIRLAETSELKPKNPGSTRVRWFYTEMAGRTQNGNPGLRWRPLIHPRNAATYPAATLHSGCGRGLVPKDAESMGREDKPLLDFSSK